MYITKNNMYQMEKLSTVDPSILMENAGEKIYEHLLPLIEQQSKIIILSGTGNNGGDGVILAHLLKKNNFQVQLCLVKQPKSSLTIEKLKNFGEDYIFYDENLSLNTDFIIDAIFGIGFRGEPDPFYQRLFTKINQSTAKIVSIDIPSGIASDTAFFHQAVKADYTFTIQCPKLSYGLKPSRENFGQLHVLDIGIPITSPPLEIVEEIHLPKRLPTSHKGTHGSGLLIAGSDRMPGAATIAAMAGVKSGLGLLTVATSPKAQSIMASHVLEAMYFHTDVDEDGYLADISTLDFTYPDVLAIGCGMGRKNYPYLDSLLTFDKPIIIDADGLFHLAQNLSWLENRKSETVILTPHEVEMCRLVGKSLAELQQNRFQIAYDFATKYHVFLVLKGPNTLITTPTGNQYVNSTGNQVLAKGGTGDMLTGMIFGLLPQHEDVAEAVKNAVYLHGMSGDLYIEKYGNHFTATISDFIQILPEVFSKVTLSNY